MATKTKLEKLVDEAIALGITLTGDEKEADLKKLIADKKAEAKANANANAGDDEEEKKTNKKDVIYYWVKIKSFISDTKTIEAGLYKTSAPVERLENSKKEYVESFIGKIPSAKLFKIAELYRVSIFEKNGEDERPSADILAELVKEL